MIPFWEKGETITVLKKDWERASIASLDFQAQLLVAIKTDPIAWHQFIDDVQAGKYEPPPLSRIGQQLEFFPEHMRSINEKLLG